MDFTKLEQEIRQSANKDQLQAYKSLLKELKIDDIIRQKENKLEIMENKETDLDLKLAYEGCSLLILFLLNYLNISNINAKLIVNSIDVFLMTLIGLDMGKKTIKAINSKPTKISQIKDKISQLQKEKAQKENLLKLIDDKIGEIEKAEIIQDIRTFVDTYGEPNLNWSVPELLKSYGVSDDCLDPEFSRFIYLLNRLGYIKDKKEYQAEQEEILSEFRLIRQKNRRNK